MNVRLIGSILALLLLVLGQQTEAKIKVGCLGNSITYGTALADPTTESYPSQLQLMLGDQYEVGNFGRPGATLLRQGHNPYMASDEFKKALEFKPDIAIVHLGVNDTDPRNMPIYGDRFAKDYRALIDSLRAVNPDIRIIICRLTPIRSTHYRFRSGTRQWLRDIQLLLPDIARSNGVELMSFDRPLRNRQNLLSDGIHPNAEGAKLLAREVYGSLTGDFGGLQLPEIYQSGMIMQRDRYLPIHGRADANADITLTLAGRSYHTKADGTGQWTVTALPLTATGEPVEMTVTDGKTTLRLTDILAGELWIASGQSNMAFMLCQEDNNANTIAKINDPQLRFFDMKPIALTDAVTWPDSIVSAMDRLQHFRPTKWTSASPANSREWSAVAYHFARQLRDSLKVPVGVIHNAVGGAPIESWVDVTSLEDQMPEILNNWLTNDYVQKWCQERARQNCGSQSASLRHPYEPSYLFSAGIEPLGHPAVKGVIWYQGESNAHNTMLHEQLFGIFADSWRRYFNDPTLPIVFCQLSSHDRPSWPMFRDSQRRLASTVDRTYMAVTSDVGDSLDVHPRLKSPVGDRLARQALHNVYGQTHITPAGPQPVAARRSGNSIIVSFTNAEGLSGRNGSPILTFEIAGSDGIFYPAQAEITENNEIKVYNMDVKKPRTVRYGWQPFTRANLVNADNLPASTFEISADDADTTPEPGIECGVSAPFAGMLAGKIITAGGCNFPSDPMAADAVKKFYRGIYAADPNTMQWQRIGSLPQPAAYGATASTDRGLVLIGGTPEGNATADVMLLTLDGDTPTLTQLPALPATLDNMAAAAIDRVVYTCGGNLNGVPSRSLFALDLDAPEKGWKKLSDMPGNPRVQPVMAAGKDSDGNAALYVWGGFAGKHNGKEATLELDGLRYDPRRNKWTRITGPKDSDGIALATGGGTALTLADGRIALAGGVNKDIFLDALRNQAPDYLKHPIEWYRFNPNVIIFDPTTEKWSIALTSADAARAGAVMVESMPGQLSLMGGELKPRIRSMETFKIILNE